MPTISQLPAARSVAPSDEVPLSQGGSLCSIAVGTLLETTQPVIVVGSPALLGRTSLGPGGPEQVEVGIGLSLSSGTVVATGADHAAYPSTATLILESDLVISNNGSQMLMPVEFLRSLFSPGQNIDIDANGAISVSGDLAVTSSAGGRFGSTTNVVTAVNAGDLVPISQLGTGCAITYSDFLNGLTVDQASLALPASDSDVIWVAQGSNVMRSQSFGAIWTWMASQLTTYEMPVIEITNSITLSAAAHNGRLLVCSQPVTIVPSVVKMASGFRCHIVNVSSGNLILDASFMTSNGSDVLVPQQSADVSCFIYSGGTVAYLNAGPVSVVKATPGQVIGLSASSLATTSISLSWQVPLSGGLPSSYLTSYRQTGTSTWISATVAGTDTSYEVSGLQSGMSYDFVVQAVNAGGVGLTSQTLTVSTTSTSSSNEQVPQQVADVIAVSVSTSTVQLSWLNQTGVGAASSYMVQFRTTGSVQWSTATSDVAIPSYKVTGLLPATSYDFIVVGVNAGVAGPASAVLSVVTEVLLPVQVNGLAATVLSASAVQLSWSSQTSGSLSLTYTVQYRLTGSTAWISITGISASAYSITGLTSSTSYDFSVFAVNTGGSGPISSTVSVATQSAGTSVSSISWNIGPGGVYASGSGTVPLNAHVLPPTAAVQFGFSTSSSVVPSSWTAGNIVNTNLWGAYVPTPSTSGSWFGWVEGVDGSSPTVFPTPFTVQ